MKEVFACRGSNYPATIRNHVWAMSDAPLLVGCTPSAAQCAGGAYFTASSNIAWNGMNGELNAAATTTEALAFFAELKALHCASWERRGKRHAFSGEFFEPFHRLLIERNFAAGGTQLLRVHAGNHTIGYLYNFRLGDRIYAYQSGFADADRREHPGVVTHALAIQHAFQSGARVYDFMAGRNRLKESFSTRSEPMLWQVIQQPRLVFRLEHLTRRFKHAIIARKPLSVVRRSDHVGRSSRAVRG